MEMSTIVASKFAKLGVDSAPGQESLQSALSVELRGPKITGTPVDFSHGDIDAHPPVPGSLEVFSEGFEEGGEQAYTPYRGRQEIREDLATKLASFSSASIDPNSDTNHEHENENSSNRYGPPGSPDREIHRGEKFP